MTRPSCLHGAATPRWCDECLADKFQSFDAYWCARDAREAGCKPWAWASLPGLSGDLIATAYGDQLHWRHPAGSYHRGGRGWYWLESTLTSERRPSREDAAAYQRWEAGR